MVAITQLWYVMDIAKSGTTLMMLVLVVVMLKQSRYDSLTFYTAAPSSMGSLHSHINIPTQQSKAAYILFYVNKNIT